METLIVHKKISKKDAFNIGVKLLEDVGISSPESRMKQYPHELSGGMRQRVMIAIALACKPEILIADEPTTALDVTIQAQILDFMNQLKHELGTSIIIITHDLGVVAEMADNVVVMYCGQVIENAPVEAIFNDSRKKHPYTAGLLKSIPDLTEDKTELEVIEGSVPNPLFLPKGCSFAPRCKFSMKKCHNLKPELKNINDTHKIRCFHIEEGGEI